MTIAYQPNDHNPTAPSITAPAGQKAPGPYIMSRGDLIFYLATGIVGAVGCILSVVISHWK